MATKITMKQKTSSGYEVLYPVTDASCVLNLKVLNTDNATTNAVSSSEALSGSGVLNLHKVAKTGTNTDIINFVGKRYGVTSLDIQEDHKGEIFNDYTNNKALGSCSSAFGHNTIASGNSAFSCGLGSTTATTLTSIPTAATALTFAVGNETPLLGEVVASLDFTHLAVVYAKNGLNVTVYPAFTSSSTNVLILNGIAADEGAFVGGYECVASGKYSASIGNRTTATGYYAFSEGEFTNALGDYSHAEGNGTHANGVGTHAEGTGTIASGSGAHAEGNNSIASNLSSHAEGFATTASGVGAHSEGENTVASGQVSHSEGFFTATGASAWAQHVSGVANIIDTGVITHGIYTYGTYANIVGGGTVNNNIVTLRKNIETLDWDGNLWSYNDIRCGGTNGLTGNYLHSLSNKLDRALEKLTFVSSIPTSGMEVGYLYATGTYDSPGTPYLALSATTTIATTYSTFVIYEDQSNGNLYEYNDTYMVPHESGYRYLKSITLSNPTITETLDLTNKSKIVKYTTTIATVAATINISALQQNIEYTLLFVAYTSWSSSFAVDLVFPAELTVYSATLPSGAYIRTASIATVTFNTKIAAKATILRTEDDVFVSLTI